MKYEPNQSIIQFGKYEVLKNFNVNVDADAIANANAGSSAIALPGLHPGELKNLLGQTKKNLLILRLSVFYF